MIMTLHGVDVSSYQPDWKPDSGDSFVFIKASEGTGYRNPERSDQTTAARKAGLQVGWYHFLSHGNIQAQADYFLATSGIQAGDLLVCDWEASGCTTADKDQFIKAVKKAKPAAKVGLYCNTNWWLNVDTSSYYGDFLWIAAYQSSKPGLQTPIKFWQYTDHPIDQNHGYFDSLQQLKAWADGSITPDPNPSTTTEPVYPTSDAIRTPYGQKGSSWASGYHQGDDWHRNAGQAEIGDPIYAVATGKIIYAGDARTDGGQGWGSAFGIHVLNQWDEHGRTSIDAHMSKLHVKTGDRVKVGQLIGEKGATGNVSGPHDHHEQHTGTRWTDPDVKPIYPGRTVPTPTPIPQTEGDDLDMADHVKRRRSTNQTFAKADTEQWLLIDEDDHVTVADKPSKITGVVYLQISGLTPTDSLYIHAGSYDVKTQPGTNPYKAITENNDDRITGEPSGWVHRTIPFVWSLGNEDKGYDYRALRFRIKASTTKAVIENVRIECWVTAK